MTISNSLIRNNVAQAASTASGSYGGSLTVTNSTFTFNTATNNGGGISNYFISSKLRLASDTVYFNFADSDNAGGGDGGGVFNNAGGGSVTTRNTLFAFNFRAGASVPSDCGGTLFSNGYNLVENNTGCVLQNGTGETIGVNPMLGLLQNNGGPTLTNALPAGSNAVNRGDPSGGKNADGSPLLVDQRGFPRLGRCDIGAYEYMVRVLMPSIQR